MADGEIVGDFFVDNVSSTAVQLRRVPNTAALPTADPGMSLHQVNLVTGTVSAAANASTAYWQAAVCVKYRVSITKIS